jgi:uncharacterized membrane protein YsdA (DUF1294 family)
MSTRDILSPAIGTVILTVLFGISGLSSWHAYLAAVNMVTLGCYGLDKYSSIGRHARMPEALLHILAAVGGTPGAFVGQVVFRHKTRKASFQRVFALIVVAQLALLLALALRR